MKIPVHNMAGELVREIEVSDTLFAQPANEAVVHQALVAQLANGRHGTSDTKTRSEVAGSTKKLYRQKHTGHARAGSAKSGLRRGGAVIFGPHPRDYTKALPKKMRRLAIRCVLSDKVAEKSLWVLDGLSFEAPKTRQMAQVLKVLGVDTSTLIALEQGISESVLKSSRNLDGVKTLPARQLSVAEMLSCQALVMTEPALREIEALWGGAT